MDKYIAFMCYFGGSEPTKLEIQILFFREKWTSICLFRAEMGHKWANVVKNWQHFTNFRPLKMVGPTK
jgi:hypothetical protein